MSEPRTGYPSDVTDPEWEFVTPYQTLMRADAPHRTYPLRKLFDGARYVVKTGCPWRYLPHDFPSWNSVYQQARRWQEAGVYEAIAHDLRIVERLLKDRQEDPTATILDARTLQSVPESGGRTGFDGAKKKNGSKVHAAVDTLGNLLALTVTAANRQERDEVGALLSRVRRIADGSVELAWADQGDTGEPAADAASKQDVQLEIVRRPKAAKGFVLLPRRWVVERTFGWLGRSRRLARDYERLAETLAGYHWLVFAGILLGRILRNSS